jgi:hypothetical protein
MVIVAVDPSVSKTGVVIRREDGTYSSFLCIPPPKSRDPARLYWITATVVKECKLKPEDEVLLVIEQPTPKRQLDINFPLFWRIREEFAWHYQVGTLKVCAQLNKFTTGDGKITEIGASVVRQWGKCLPDEYDPDLLDALALCKFGEVFLGLEQGTRAQRELVAMEGTGKARRQRVAVDDHETFRICKGGE